MQDDCENNLLLTASSLPDIVYLITDGIVSQPAFTGFLNSPVYCPITYSTTISPTPPASIVTLDQATLVYTINTADSAAIAIYTVTTTCLTHRGSDSGTSFDFQLDVDISCISTTFNTFTVNAMTYTIFETSDT